MRRILFALVVVMLVLCLGPSNSATGRIRQSQIVSTDWVAQHLNDESLVLLQVGVPKEYEIAHLPRAQLIQLSDISTPRGQGLTLELPSVDQLKTTFERFGVTNKSWIVIYFSKDWVSPTARVFMTLDYLGLGDRTSILDGGLPAWQAEGKLVTAEIQKPKPGKFTPHPKTDLVVDADWVRMNLGKPGVALLDARDAKFYSGAEAGQMPRAGHIPSARSIPFSSLVQAFV